MTEVLFIGTRQSVSTFLSPCIQASNVLLPSLYSPSFWHDVNSNNLPVNLPSYPVVLPHDPLVDESLGVILDSTLYIQLNMASLATKYFFISGVSPLPDIVKLVASLSSLGPV